MWFKKNKATPAGPETRPLTFESVRSVFEKNDWPHMLEEVAGDPIIRTHADGIISSVFAVDMGFTVLRAWPLAWLTEERFPEVLAWVEGFNNNSPFPTVAVYQEEDMWALHASFLIPNHWEYTDEQLKVWLECGIFGVMDVGNAFFTAFNVENPDKK